MEKLFRKAGWLLITVLFLASAWATSIDEPYEIRTLPLDARVEGTAIWIKNDSAEPLSDLSLVLNGIYTYNNLSLAANAEARIPLADFADRNQQTYPPSEKPHVLEVFQNGSSAFPGSAGSGGGGYAKFEFE